MTDETPTVLIVDDDEDVVDVYALALGGTYEIVKALDGEEALSLLDDTVDVVLLDRRMPGPSGRDVLAEIRDREADVRVAMVTAVDPDFDIATMPFDGYVTKPVDDEELRSTVSRLVSLSAHDDQTRELFAVAEKLAALEAEKTAHELSNSDDYADLRDRAAELDAAATETVGEMEPETFDRVLSEFHDG
ncbi:response regulator [Haloarcula litorea]|uniref:response regulator n=1 Tax=Haloarcula litorea TaxID=3032579 RepID=UPI0023E7843B|nr:response regulator [Halomicroarcula sp. GDY20]